MRIRLTLLLVVAFAVPVIAQEAERIAEVRVHGNHTTPEADIVAVSGLAAGQDASEARLRDAEQKLRDTSRFEAIELRRRYLSIADPSRILIMIVVDEHPAVNTSDLTPGPLRKFTSAGMWMPILRHEDGYGLTYGVRYGFNDALGADSRVAIPSSWGGERRVGIEAERQFDGPIRVVRGGVSMQRRVNPHFDLPDTRREARVEVDRAIRPWLRVGAGARTATMTFGEAYQARHTAGGVHAVFDTRIDPSFPRNAVYVRLAWERLAFHSDRASLWTADVRGYVGVVGSTVLALRGQLATSNAALPSAEQSLLGGNSSVRGYRTGYRANDNLAAATVEIRQPINSPLSVGRVGVKTFVDLGTTWSSAERIGARRFDLGIGAGGYLGAGPFIVDLDVAWPRTGDPRAHFGFGVSF